MGEFVSVLVVQNDKENDVKKALKKIGGSNPHWNWILEECQYKQYDQSVEVLLNDMCSGYEDIPQRISKELGKPSLLCYIYDGDYWGYYFMTKQWNWIVSIPCRIILNMFQKKKKQLSGNSRVISQYFHVEEEKMICKYGQMNCYAIQRPMPMQEMGAA